MTQLDAGAAPPAAPSAPEPSAAPVVDPTPQPSPQPAGEAMTQVPTSQLDFVDGRYGEALKYGRAYQEIVNSGYGPIFDELRANYPDPQQFLEAWNGYVDSQAAPAAANGAVPTTPTEPEDPDSKAMTVGDWKKLQKEASDTSRAESDREEQARAVTEAQAAETKATQEVVQSIKAKPDDVRGKSATRMFVGAINEAMEERLLAELPAHATAKDRQELLNAIPRMPTTEADIAKAKELFRKDWADLTNESAAFVATQDQDATASLAGGAGGPQAPNDLSKLTVQEYDAMDPDKVRDIHIAELQHVRKAGGGR